ncbi:hypothetical protein NA56DRAFT_264416 [Hyaloscypha hepaticicola]|uniref:F-box domain-containing protein n=1 Tax=Hyaloscypha hepaticicola TaxID=2082293 RepID=A0A2J6PUJ6_9HELO|nr:hypothetical protein NA56DRAFT_264416 [Hyaloscypha hepaticicola]
MPITDLSTEILQKIFEYTELADLIHLSQTSKQNYRAFLGRRMHHLECALHNSYSPLPTLLKLTLANEPSPTRRPIGTEVRIALVLNRITSVPANPKLTLENMKKMVHYGKIADRWTELYPRLRWRFASDNRRLLKAQEKERLRGAVYNHWAYTTLFHSRTFTNYSPDPPSPASLDDPRHRLLRTLSTVQQIQLSEYLSHIETLVELDLYPSYSVVLEQYPHSLPHKSLSKLGWGEGSEYRRLVRDIMKLGPEDLLHLYEHTSTKSERADFLCAQGVCFGDVPATMNYALSSITVERERLGYGLDGSKLRSMISAIHYPSLRSSTGMSVGSRLAEEEKDLPDEELVFGIVELPGRGKLEGLERVIERDGVQTGEWEAFVAAHAEIEE